MPHDLTSVLQLAHAAEENAIAAEARATVAECRARAAEDRADAAEYRAFVMDRVIATARVRSLFAS